MALQFRSGGLGGQIEKRGVNVEKFDRLRALGILRDAGTGEDERDMGGRFPEGVLSGDELFTEMPAVVAPEDDDGVVGATAFLKSGEQPTDLGIHEAGACEVGLHQ